MILGPVTAALALLTAPAHGAEAPLSVRIERALPDGFRAQMGLVFEEGRVVFTRNSNFGCRPSRSAVLGRVEMPYERSSRSWRRMVEQLELRLRKRASDRLTGEPERTGEWHATRAHVGRFEVSRERERAASIEGMFRRACAHPGWKAVEAVAVTSAGAKALEPRGKRPVPKPECEGGACRVKDWGRVDLLP